MNAEAIGRIECHDDLLKNWESQLRPFNRDGIISPAHWDTAALKVLFVLKEANHKNKDQAMDVVASIRRACDVSTSVWWRKHVLRRVGRWAYGLVHYSGQVPAFKDARYHGAKSIPGIAYINMKKSPGGASTNSKRFDAHVRQFAPFIRRQIELIKPDVVVLCGTFSFMKASVFPEMARACERIHLCNDMVFINAYHPAQKTISAEELYRQVMDSYHYYTHNVRHKRT